MAFGIISTALLMFIAVMCELLLFYFKNKITVFHYNLAKFKLLHVQRKYNITLKCWTVKFMQNATTRANISIG